MIPGRQSKTHNDVIASADTIIVKSDVVKVSGSTTINTIFAPLSLSVQGGIFLVLIPTDGAITLGTSGNILVGISAAQNRAVFMVYDSVVGKWYINSGV